MVLVQSSQTSDEDDGELPAPTAAGCVIHCSDVVDAFKDLVNEAKTEADETLHAESSAAHNFLRLWQSLDDQSTQDYLACQK